MQIFSIVLVSVPPIFYSCQLVHVGPSLLCLCLWGSSGWWSVRGVMRSNCTLKILTAHWHKVNTAHSTLCTRPTLHTANYTRHTAQGTRLKVHTCSTYGTVSAHCTLHIAMFSMQCCSGEKAIYMLGIWQGHAKDMPGIYQGYTKKVPMLYQRYAKHMPKVWPRYA